MAGRGCLSLSLRLAVRPLRPHGRVVGRLALRPSSTSVQERPPAPVPTDLHRPPSKDRPASTYPHLVFTAEPCVADPFRKHSAILTALPLGAAILAVNVLPTSVAWLGCAFLWPLVRCTANVARTCPRLVLWTDPDHQTVQRTRPPEPSPPPPDPSDPSEASKPRLETTALQPRGDAPPPAVPSSTNEFDPWGKLVEDEIVMFTHAQVELLRSVFSTTARHTRMVPLAEVEWLGFEEAVTDTGRELHCWRLIKLKGVQEPYNIFLSDRFDVALPSLINANPGFKVCAVSPLYNWDVVPIFGYKLDRIFEPGDLPQPSSAKPPNQSPPSDPNATPDRSP
jgi:hypothetical protein